MPEQNKAYAGPYGVRTTVCEGKDRNWVVQDVDAWQDLWECASDLWLGDVTIRDALGMPKGKHGPSSQGQRHITACSRTTTITSWIAGGDADFVGKEVEQLREQLVGDGWPQGVQRLLGVFEAVRNNAPMPKSIRSRYAWTDEGDDYDPIRAYSGELDRSFGGFEPSEWRGPRTVRLVTRFGGHAGEDAETFFWRAAPLLAVADALETAGFNVEILACAADTAPNAEKCVRRVTVKQAGQNLDLSALALICCTAAFFRHCGYVTNAASPWSHSGGSRRTCGIR